MKLICGLGNPGLRYKNTRHNVGFLTIDNFVKINKGRVDNKEIFLLKPQVFMNNSGAAVREAVKKFDIELKDILIVCDDINLELGTIRFRAKGSAGGHRGLKSIIEELNTENFNRLRIGIGSDSNTALRDYVLSKFRADEKKLLKEVVNKAAEAIPVWVEEGIEAAMNGFNKKVWR